MSTGHFLLPFLSFHSVPQDSVLHLAGVPPAPTSFSKKRKRKVSSPHSRLPPRSVRLRPGGVHWTPAPPTDRWRPFAGTPHPSPTATPSTVVFYFLPSLPPSKSAILANFATPLVRGGRPIAALCEDTFSARRRLYPSSDCDRMRANFWARVSFFRRNSRFCASMGVSHCSK